MTKVLRNENIQMFYLALLACMLLSGHAATCSAFTTMAGQVSSRCHSTLSSLPRHWQTPEISTVSLGVDREKKTPVPQPATSRRKMIISSAALVVSQVAVKVNADVSDGNALPEGAQQFARTIKLKTDLKVWN